MRRVAISRVSIEVLKLKLSLLDANALVKQVDVRLAKSLLHVLLSDQSGNVHVSLVDVVVIFASAPHDAPDRRDPFNLVLALLATILVPHRFPIIKQFLI